MKNKILTLFGGLGGGGDVFANNGKRGPHISQLCPDLALLRTG